MSKDYPDRSVWLAKRCTPPRETYERLVFTGGTFRRRRPGPTHIGKSGVRADKKMRMAALHANFMNDAALINRADDLGLMMFLPEQIRRVRDTVLGSRPRG